MCVRIPQKPRAVIDGSLWDTVLTAQALLSILIYLFTDLSITYTVLEISAEVTDYLMEYSPC